MVALESVIPVTCTLLMIGSDDTTPVLLTLNVMNSSGAEKLELWFAVSDATLLEIASISQRVSILTVTVWFEASPVALKAAAVFAMSRHRTVVATAGLVGVNKK